MTDGFFLYLELKGCVNEVVVLLIRGTVEAFAWMGWRKITNRYPGVSRCATEIRPRNLPNRIQGHYIVHELTWGRGVNKVNYTVLPGHDMQAYLGSAALAALILNPTGRLYSPAASSSGKNSGVHSVGGWIGPRARGPFVREKHLMLLPVFEPRFAQPVARSVYTLRRLGSQFEGCCRKECSVWRHVLCFSLAGKVVSDWYRLDICHTQYVNCLQYFERRPFRLQRDECADKV